MHRDVERGPMLHLTTLPRGRRVLVRVERYRDGATALCLGGFASAVIRSVG